MLGTCAGIETEDVRKGWKQISWGPRKRRSEMGGGRGCLRAEGVFDNRVFSGDGGCGLWSPPDVFWGLSSIQEPEQSQGFSSPPTSRTLLFKGVSPAPPFYLTCHSCCHQRPLVRSRPNSLKPVSACPSLSSLSPEQGQLPC